jgi:hypothetical protein
MVKAAFARPVHLKILAVCTICAAFVLGAYLLHAAPNWPPHSPPPASPESQTPLIVVAYGDTRTGWWGLGSNSKQNIHGYIVDSILAQGQLPNAVIFNGDAVMTNFFLWKGSYWKDFLRQSDKFVRHSPDSIPFYPSMGNHEAETNKPVLMQSLDSQLKLQEFGALSPGEIQESREDQIGDEYEKGEDDYGKMQLSAVATTEQAPKANGLLLNEKESQDEIRKMGRLLDKGENANLAEQKRAAYFLGAAGAAVQQEYYASLAEEKGCGKDPDLLHEAYIQRAKYGFFLDKVLPSKQSYYSVVLSQGPISLKVIALDTNCLISTAQQDFLEHELANFNGPIVVYGHHPPVDENLPAPYWDKPPGIEFLRSHFSDKRVRLWIFGHVHDYQRRNASASGDVLPSPVLLISGGGGASLKKDGANYNQWQPKDWPEPGRKTMHSPDI